MSDINKRIHENASALAKVKAGGCGTCEGLKMTCTGKFPDDCPHENVTEHSCEDCHLFKPCPTCATLREIAEYHWHEWVIGGDPAYPDKGCMICNGWKRNDGIDNPTYTVQTMRTLLEELAEWEGFKDDLFASLLQKILGTIDYRVAEAMKKFADIITSDPDMRQAVDAYLKHRIGEVA